MSFANTMKQHLGAYRTQILCRQNSGSWGEIPKSHILTEEDKETWNYLPEVRSELAQYVQEHSIKLHQYFAHLNSSQALALNLFFPLLLAEESHLPWGNPSHISRLLGRHQLQIKTGRFEAIFDQEERTNFDWIAELTDGGSIFCELKYTESSFGSASSPTTDYLHRFQNIYRPRLKGVIPADRLESSQLVWFKKNYQILRNLSYLNWGQSPQKNRVLFVLPKHSPSFHQLQDFLAKEASPEARSKVIVRDLASWVADLESNSASKPETKHWKDFREKYIPNEFS